MAKQAKSYGELKTELQSIIEQLQDESLDIDKALELHEKANKLISELEKHLEKIKHKFEIIKKKK